METSGNAGQFGGGHSFQGKGIGSYLIYALHEFETLSRTVGLGYVVVDAKDADGVRFYQHYGFQPFRDDPMRLIIPMSTVREAVCRYVERAVS